MPVGLMCLQELPERCQLPFRTRDNPRTLQRKHLPHLIELCPAIPLLDNAFGNLLRKSGIRLPFRLRQRDDNGVIILGCQLSLADRAAELVPDALFAKIAQERLRAACVMMTFQRR